MRDLWDTWLSATYASCVLTLPGLSSFSTDANNMSQYMVIGMVNTV
jgi:hypothetical protein